MLDPMLTEAARETPLYGHVRGGGRPGVGPPPLSRPADGVSLGGEAAGPGHVMDTRLLALLGSIAFGIRRFVASVLSFVGLRSLARVAVPLLVVVFAAAAVLSARDTATILGSRPDVQQTTLAEVAGRSEDDGGSIWFEFDALMDDSHLDVPADLGFFYLARDPADASAGLLVRSNSSDPFVRVRVVSATLTEDEAVVDGAIEAIGQLPSGFSVDRTRYLDETANGGQADEAFQPSELGDEEAGIELPVSGRVVSPGQFAACANDEGCDGADAAWFYYLADAQGGSAIVIRSPYPPDAQPVRLQGLYERDTFDLAPVLTSDWFAAIDVEVPTERAFSADRRPPITVQASWIPTIIFAILAALLLASQLVGYPVFGRVEPPRPARTVEPGQGIEVDITGHLEREGAAITLDRSPGAVERLDIADLALRTWRYGMLPRGLSRREAEERFVTEARGESDRLVIHERDQSALVTLSHEPGATTVESGRLYRASGSAPALHVRQGRTDAYLTTASAEDRDRAAAELLAEIETRSA